MNDMPEKFKFFISEFTEMIDRNGGSETNVFEEGKKKLCQLIEKDDWLPERYAQPDIHFYQQYLLYADPQDRFSVVSFVWGPGQKTPVHNHLVWALIGMLRGSELSERFEYAADGKSLRSCPVESMKPGDVGAISPTLGDIHKVSNFYDDRVSISVHVYGGNIGRISRHVFVPETGEKKPFVSGYANERNISATA